MGNNQFSYCSNNPINRVDPNGQLWQEIADFFREIYYGAKQVAESSPSVYAVGGVAGVIDGPSPIADAIVVVGLVAIVAGVESISLKIKSKTKEKEKEQEKVAAAPIGNTYYHATTLENAYSIIASQTLIGSPMEGGYVYAWLTLPGAAAVANSGARGNVVISFKTTAAFTIDPGVEHRAAQLAFPLRSVFPGPIAIYDVKIVYGAKE